MYAVKGDLIEVKKVSETEYADKDGNTYDKNELVLLEEMETEPVDWEQRRYEIAKDIMAASFYLPMDGANIVSYAHNCVQWADALIEELKKTRK
ncbi:hypothetical protein [Prevotella amnii]|uniref:Uncharacterized protein n=1 Tax=Prevotella amnii DNF00058 TaxID=1401066 RepID=A0A096AZY8_9BACT|nr:hypothetical protein [Prevotella amnii]KGF52380.1 hypothetical protein HMPREF9302_03550 [Prevotella amnii DNF00058]